MSWLGGVCWNKTTGIVKLSSSCCVQQPCNTARGEKKRLEINLLKNNTAAKTTEIPSCTFCPDPLVLVKLHYWLGVTNKPYFTDQIWKHKHTLRPLINLCWTCDRSGAVFFITSPLSDLPSLLLLLLLQVWRLHQRGSWKCAWIKIIYNILPGAFRIHYLHFWITYDHLT